jgi:hypothetical protein
MVKPLVPPMVDILGPYVSTPQHELARPGKAGDAAGAGFSWLKDCTDENAEDGTPLTAEHLNNYKAQFLTLFQESGIDIDDVDEMLAYAVQSGRLNFAAATGTANAWLVNPALAIPAYWAGRVVWIKAPANNTSSAVTATFGALATRPVKKADASNLQQGDIVGGRWYPTIDDGTNICVVSTLPSDMAAIASGLVIPLNVQVFTAGGTYTPSAGLVALHATLVGGGGGGGNASAPNFGGGGGNGAYTEGFYLLSEMGAGPYTVTIGTGGNGGAISTANPGTAGGNTSFLGLLARGGGAGGGSGGGNGTPGAGGNTTGALTLRGIALPGVGGVLGARISYPTPLGSYGRGGEGGSGSSFGGSTGQPGIVIIREFIKA